LVDPAVLTVLAFGHILSAVGWLGGGLITAFVVGPGLQTMSAPSRLEFTSRVNPKLVRYMGGMIGGTFIFGLLLLYYGGYYTNMSPSTANGVALSGGVALALVAAVIAMVFTFPAFRKIASMAEASLKSGQPAPEMMKYARRARSGALAGSALLVLVLVLMVTAGFY
jgi:uncharacterized membrane protein